MSSAPTIGQSAYFVVLCQGVRADGDPYWAYLQLSPLKVKLFKKAQESGSFQLEEYGEIIEWGVGEQVPSDIMQRMERDHHVNHDFEKELRQSLS